MVNVKIQICGGMIPTRAHEDDACFDLYAPTTIALKHGRQIIPLGFKVQVPFQWCAYIRSRSGFASKGLTAYLSCDKSFQHPVRIDADVITGIVDSGFRGEVGVILKCGTSIYKTDDEWVRKLVDARSRNMQTEEKWDGVLVIREGERIAQMAILPVPDVQFEEVEELSDSERGEGGFGSSNEKAEGGES